MLLEWMIEGMNKYIEKLYKYVPILNRGYYCGELYDRLKIRDISKSDFASANCAKVRVYSNVNKEYQLCKLIKSIDISPISNYFFYCIDVYKFAPAKRGSVVFDNFTPNYINAIGGTINDSKLTYALKKYLERAEASVTDENHRTHIISLKEMFGKEAKSFEEGLQRILFINQFFWQTGHTLVGVGHLDWLLGDLYLDDFKNNRLSKERAKFLVEQFIKAIHSYYEYKSNSLLGDTGQVIILGGNKNGIYICNELTYLIMDVISEMQLPDPKLLVRYGDTMPNDLFISCINMMATGIGSPLLSNDEIVVKSMINFGYSEQDSNNYGVSACWEPLSIGNSFDNNNCSSINFAEPFVKTINDVRFNECENIDSVVAIYEEYLISHIKDTVGVAQRRVYDEDPMINILSDEYRKNRQDFCRGGAKYSNTGFTSVGMSTVIDSLLIIEQYAFKKNIISLKEIQRVCKENYKDSDDFVKLTSDFELSFGRDNEHVVSLTNRVMGIAALVLNNERTRYGGGYKIGFSSPNYITLGCSTAATPDGRRDGGAFSTHISSNRPIAYTELLNFASKLNYNQNIFNGNVVDFVAPAGFLKEHIREFCILIKKALEKGIFQLQINVLDSSQLIEAKKNPEKYKRMIVRVWGFSAYFVDLPEEYQNRLIQRALESERKYEG